MKYYLVLLGLLISLALPLPSESSTITNYRDYKSYKSCNSIPTDNQHGWRCIYTRTEPKTLDTIWMEQDCTFYGLDVGGETSIFSQVHGCKYIYLRETNTLRVYRKFKEPEPVTEPECLWVIPWTLVVLLLFREYKREKL